MNPATPADAALPPPAWPEARSFRVERFQQPLVPHRAATDAPRGRELLLRTRRCGVCHSDLHLVDGFFDMGGGQRLHMAEQGVEPPITPGHEIVAELLAAGPAADLQGLRIGGSYLVYPWIGCGRCSRCRKGLENLCIVPRVLGIQRSGGYGEIVSVPHGRYLVDIEGLEPTAAATLACSGLTAYSAIRKGLGAPDDWLALVGLGGVGSAALLIARGLGYENIAAVDLDDAKLAWARANGAGLAINAADPQAANRLRSGSGGMETVVDFVGSSASARFGLDVLLRGGSYIAVGLFGGDIGLPLPSLPTRSLTLRGSYTGSLAELHALVALAKAGKVPPLPVQAIRQEEVNQAHARLRRGEVALRQVIHYDGDAHGEAPLAFIPRHPLP